jgi:hypothetical protein
MVIGMTNADATGAVSFTWTIPASVELGQHSVALSGPTSGTTEVSFTVTAAAGPATVTVTPTGNLASTGTSISPALIGSAAAFILAGIALLIAAARTRPYSHR